MKQPAPAKHLKQIRRLSSERQEAYNFILTNRAAALATVDMFGMPHVATVYCVVKKDLSLYFCTRVESRKFSNLVNNKFVSMAFSNEHTMKSLQLTGTVERINNLEQEQDILHDLILLRYGEPNWPVPPVKLFEAGATNELAIFKVRPFEMTHATFATSTTGRYKPFFKTII